MRLIALTALLAALVPAFALAAEEPRVRTIATSGEAVVYVAPDEAIIHVGVESFNASLNTSKEINDEASGRLLRALKDLKIEDKHIGTAAMEIELRYKNHDHPSNGIEGYYTRRNYAVTLKDIKIFEKVLDTALKNGANRLMGFEFRTSELRKHRDAARKLAVKAAREKAVALAEELNCTIGFPVTISEGSFGNYGAWNRSSNLNAFQYAAQVMPGGGEGGETLPLGQIGISANVSVTFDLNPTK